ncbi:Hypothetical protein I595_859 [Croceitalea dokdonensis DOKDO 023]|uniref:Uncharacterized protein n=1 Tax=Croceitalea dokdonensis DOKDO 023 TaxID=1300341 RepID=A0A0P7AG77_9FLAO|nr:Hypothetical protein I595_859 [Croceitalea dokdonensis DOKDO 023]
MKQRNPEAVTEVSQENQILLPIDNQCLKQKFLRMMQEIGGFYDQMGQARP